VEKQLCFIWKKQLFPVEIGFFNWSIFIKKPKQSLKKKNKPLLIFLFHQNNNCFDYIFLTLT